MGIAAMRIEQLRQADLNLLVYYVVLFEERSITRAAARLRLSQPALTRALQRLRTLFEDELLVKTVKGYEATPRGQGILDELSTILPQLDCLISGSKFNPTREHATFRIVATDNAAQLYCPVLSRLYRKQPNLRFDFLPWSDHRFHELDESRAELVLDANFGPLSSKHRCELLFKDDFVCVVAKESVYGERLTLNDYMAAGHIMVNVFQNQQMIPEITLARLGLTRRIAFSVPYFTVALQMVAGTPLIATIPKRLAAAAADRSRTRLVDPPDELTGYDYLMIWHSRLDGDPQNRWLRGAFRSAGQRIAPLL